MRIAIYHGFTIIHYEMLGYLIEYFLKSKIEINIYADMSIINDLEWYEYYNKLFNIEMKWYSCNNFNPNNYDYIILLTDDDYSFKEEWINKDKIIIIDHSAHIRRANNNVLERIGTRFFSNRPSCKWALPCYNGISKINKIKYLENEDKINIVCIGIQNRPPSIFFLKKLFNNFNNIIFHIISRNLDNIYLNYDNIKTYLYCPTKLMFEIVKKSHYILCIDNPHNSEPIANSMSGAIPISFSYGCNLIIPSIWQKYYNFKSIIEYNDNTILTLNKEIPLNTIYDELYYLISHRNIVIDNIIYKNIINKKYYSDYSIILFSFNLKLPNIIIIDNYNDYLCLDFREIHCNILNKIIPHSYIYNNIDYNKIKEPFIKIFNNNNLNLQDIEIISSRVFNDIIILEDINNISSVLEIYNKNKYSLYYNYKNMIIIYPF
jgi:hypothetical protein